MRMMGAWARSLRGPSVRDGHTLESMVEQTLQNNNGKQEINTQYLRGSAVCLHPRD
jgi:hypothetical protein